MPLELAEGTTAKSRDEEARPVERLVRCPVTWCMHCVPTFDHWLCSKGGTAVIPGSVQCPRLEGI